MAKKKKSFKYLFDKDRKFIPLHWILDEEERKDKVLLGRVLAIYDTFCIRGLGLEGITELFIEKESGQRKGRGKISEKKKINIKLKKEMQNEMIRMMAMSLVETKIYQKLVKAKWVPLVYCGDATFSMKIFTKRRH